MERVKRGELRIYLGCAPGVGKTYRALEEAHRRFGRGTDVVLGLVETHNRRHTADLLDGLELVPRRTVHHRGTEFTEMDLDAILTRKPQVVLVDELAHTNVPGCRNGKRWQDVAELLEAGITVLSTVNIQHLESLNDVITQITGVVQRETVPDVVVRAAEQVELVDMTPEALRRRMAHGNIYALDVVDSALGNYFRTGNLTALRELALLWVADKVDDQLDRYRHENGITRTWEARERIVVALTGGPEGETILRRAARIAERTTGGELVAVHVARSDGLIAAAPDHLIRQRALVEDMGGTYHQVMGNDIATAVLDFARGVNATQLVIGASRRGPIAARLSAGVGRSISASSGPIDVHLVHHEATAKARRSRSGTSVLSVRRRVSGFGVAAIGLPLLFAMLVPAGEDVSLSTDIVLVLGTVIAVALIGGLYPAIAASVAGFLFLDYFFSPPIHSLAIGDGQNLLALAIFLVVAVAVSTVVEIAARRTADAALARAESDTLSTLAGSVLRGASALPALLDRLRETFAMDSVTLLERQPDAAEPDLQHDPDNWRIVATTGEKPSRAPDEGDVDVPADDNLTLVLRGRPLLAAEQRVVAAFAAQTAVALHQQRLVEQAAALAPLAEVDRMRTALLSAVSHDLRTPLAAAMAAVASLRGTEVEFSAEDRDSLLATAQESLDRLNRLVVNLLDMSRLQAGALGVHLKEIGIEEVMPGVIADLGSAADALELHVPDDLPAVRTDPALLERVLVNLIGNALRYGPPDRPPAVTAAAHDDRMWIRVIDHGPGIPETDRERAFLPFQRLGDRYSVDGVGLGLALARGLTEAMGGTIIPETTPGGGLTMIVALPWS
ncbi:ATP-binding protein [Nocardia sp. NPDC050175]|uniref:ATP-binding protein n=1 Tax=Nocardia sp. NPDC050175 TaxID=3364317 RepID=UPI00379DDE2A